MCKTQAGHTQSKTEVTKEHNSRPQCPSRVPFAVTFSNPIYSLSWNCASSSSCSSSSLPTSSMSISRCFEAALDAACRCWRTFLWSSFSSSLSSAAKGPKVWWIQSTELLPRGEGQVTHEGVKTLTELLWGQFNPINTFLTHPLQYFSLQNNHFFFSFFFLFTCRPFPGFGGCSLILVWFSLLSFFAFLRALVVTVSFAIVSSYVIIFTAKIFICKEKAPRWSFLSHSA